MPLGSPFWERFLRVWPFLFCFVLFFLSFFFFFFYNFFSPTIEVVLFRLRGWCMLSVFLLPASTRLGHECQGLLSPCHGMHVCQTRLVYTLNQKSFGGMESEAMLTPGGKSLYRKNSPQRKTEPATLHHAGQQAQHTTN